MKYLFSFLFITFFAIASRAQKYDSIAPYQRDSSLPRFVLLNKDSSWFNTKTDLPKHKPVVIIFFNPDCSHCQHEAQELVKSMDKLKKIYFLWTTYFPPFSEIDSFSHEYGLDKFSNVHFYKDPNYLVPSFYRIEMTPFVAAYDKKGKLVRVWTAGAKPEEILDALK